MRERTPACVERAVGAFLRAFRTGRPIEGLSADYLPRCRADAYAIQDRLFERLGGPVGGWFASCTNPEVQRLLGIDGPYAARIPARRIRASPFRLRPPRHVPVVLEAEIAFRLAEDLPPRGRPYGRADVAEAVSAVHPSLEVVISYLANWTHQPFEALVAEGGARQWLVHGDGMEDWRPLDLARQPVHLVVNGRRARHGRGANVKPDPLGALVWLANHVIERGNWLRAGHIHNTGTCTGLYWAKPGDRAMADFGELGRVKVRLSRSH